MITKKVLDINIGKKQAEAIKMKANAWLLYINRLATELNVSGETCTDYSFKHATLWSTTFSLIEWLLTFGLYESTSEYINVGDVAPSLKSYWGWSEELGKLFWKSGRHPMSHVGGTNVFFSYYSFNSMPTSVCFDASKWSKGAIEEWGKYPEKRYRAAIILSPLIIENGPVQMVTFFHQMLRDELLPILIDTVTQKIMIETDTEKLSKLYRLNSRIPH